MKQIIHFTRLALIAPLALAACDCGQGPADGEGPLGDGFARITVTGDSTLVLSLSRPVDSASVAPSAFSVASYTFVPPDEAEVKSATLAGESDITIGTSPLAPGRVYTLTVDGLKDASGYPIAGSLNFTAKGSFEAVPFEAIIPDVETARRHEELALLVTVEPEGGTFSERFQVVPVVDEGDRFVASFTVQIDPNRTVDRADDGDPSVDRRPYAARLVDGLGRPASPLHLFVLPDAAAPRSVEIDVLPPPEIVVPEPVDPLPDPPVDDAADGVKVVRIVVDDRFSQELVNPQLKLSFDATGAFDSLFPQTVALEPLEGYDPGYYHAVVRIRVDPNRVDPPGPTEDTFPYFAYLISGGVEYEGLLVSMVAPDETPETVRLSLGEAEWTPVMFRVDVSRAYVTPDGSVRGMHPGEAIFLTGAWQRAVDALGNNCSDSYSGGESLNLKMRELDGHPGVWTKTLWLPRDHPYEWKVVRCDAAAGCGPLNQLVSSSGSAFATVMKNLTTDNVDRSGHPEVGLIDPLAPENTDAGGQIYDYTDAVVYEGMGAGSEPDPAGTPDGARMFKQEVSNIIVVVGDEPVKTRVFHVGTWRDVNLGQTPSDIIENASVVQLNPTDYDDGFQGAYPPSREEP